MTDPVNLKHEAAKRNGDVEFSVEEALKIALKEYEDRDNEDGLFCGDEVMDVYIAFRTKRDSRENFPSITSAGPRLSFVGLLFQHLSNETG